MSSKMRCRGRIVARGGNPGSIPESVRRALRIKQNATAKKKDNRSFFVVHDRFEYDGFGAE